jgi:flagellin
MSEITLSKAVRSNLLNLQSTASLLSKSQERLSSGLRVNSALDNPTNFFTAQGLNSRANDLSQLSDAVSNAVQTVAAADKGISAITKLVESAQATARQALQTAATVSTTTAATAGTVTAGAFTSLDVSGTASAATAGSLTGAGFAAIDVSGAGQAATQSTITAGGTFTNIDLSDDAGDALTFDITLGSDTVSINLDRTGVGAGAGGDDVYDIDEAIAEIQAQLDAFNSGAGLGVTVGKNLAGDTLTFTADVAGATALTVDNAAVVDGGAGGGVVATVGDLGITNAATTGQTDTGDALVVADSISFSLTAEAGGAQSITLSAASVLDFNTNGGGSANASALTAQNVADIINYQAGASVAASVTSGQLTVSSATTGGSSTIAISAITNAGTPTGSTGLTGGSSDTGSAAVVADSVTFTLTAESGGAQSITIDDAAVDTYNTANGTTLDSSALSAQNVADIINSQSGPNFASVVGGALTFTSTTTGTGSTMAVSGFATTGTVGGSTGISDNSDTGSAAGTGTTTNPKRAELVSTYNDLLGQIDALAKDASFNGVNLLNGDNLSVLFNEDGSSSLSISGVTNTSTGLGLSALGTTAFDTNTSINSTLDDLKSSIDTLRSQSAKFGSNLSVVETRQDFTKQMISVLQTGAANLTLADTNEEAANVLALQTRQQLSSTALSLASQADQNVLRLF